MSMSQIILEIDGQREDVGVLWVHLQEPIRAPAFQYRIIVPSVHLKQVFDPSSTIDPNKSLLEYINELVTELGTFIVEGYLENIRKIIGVERKRFRWVIASVHGIREVAEGIELTGKALCFDPSLY